jgi:hypothetical protein
MTKEQILGIAEGTAVVVEQQNQLLQRFNQPVHHPQPNAFDLDRELPDGEYADNAKVKTIFRHLANQPQPQDSRGAQALLGIIQIQRSDEFKRWRNEITAELSKLSMEHWTLDNLNVVVDIVKSRHIDDLAAEKAQRIVSESHPTIRSGSGGSGSVTHTQPFSLDSDKVPASWALAAKAAGITEAEVREFCEQTGQTVQQYMADLERFGKGAIVRG